MEKRYYWLKLNDNFFKDKRMKKLRRIAGGDTYTIIYLKMMLSSLTTGGMIYYEGIEDSLAEELALDLDEDPDNVQVLLNFLMTTGLMIDLGDGGYELPQASESMGSETAGAQRVRDHRARQKALQCNTDETEKALHCNTYVTEVKQDETEVKRECCVEKEIEKEIEKDNINTYVNQVIDEYNSICKSLPKAEKITEKRKRLIKARLRDKYTIEDFKKVFEKAQNSAFLRGETGRVSFKPGIDWLLNETNLVKVLEGNYDDKPGGGGGVYVASRSDTLRMAEQLAESQQQRAQREWVEENRRLAAEYGMS